MKIFIIVLVLVAVLFAVSVGIGIEDDKETQRNEQKLKDGDSPSWVDTFKGFADSRKPKVKLSQELIKVPGLSELPVPKAKDKEKFRMLTLAWESGGAVEVELHAGPPPKGLEEVKDPQVVVLADVKKSSKVRENVMRCREASLMVFENGGTIKFKMAATGPSTPTQGTIRVK